MPDYGDCYQSTGSKCSGRPQPGTVALSAAVRALYEGIGTLGIYNCRPSSGGGGLSTHGEGRGWDAACNANTPQGRVLGDRLAADLVVAHRALGIQRIIWNRRQTDTRAGMGNWRPYSGASPHTDHLHIECCWSSARDNPLTVEYVKMVLGGGENDMAQVPQAEWDEVVKLVKAMDDRIRRVEIRTRLNHDARTIGTDVKKLADLHPPAAPVPDDE